MEAKTLIAQKLDCNALSITSLNTSRKKPSLGLL